MNHVKVTTSHRARDLLSMDELPEKVRKDFDYVEKDDYSCRFVQYKGAWYDVYDSMNVQSLGRRVWAAEFGLQSLGAPDPFHGWDGYVPETFFSGVLFKLVDDERVIVGRYCV